MPPSAGEPYDCAGVCWQTCRVSLPDRAAPRSIGVEVARLDTVVDQILGGGAGAGDLSPGEMDRFVMESPTLTTRAPRILVMGFFSRQPGKNGGSWM